MPADPRYGRIAGMSTPSAASIGQPQQPRIPNYFGMWDQQLSAYFWNPTLAMVATGQYDDMPPTPREGDFTPIEFESPSCGRQPRCEDPSSACPFYRMGVS